MTTLSSVTVAKVLLAVSVIISWSFWLLWSSQPTSDGTRANEMEQGRKNRGMRGVQV